MRKKSTGNAARVVCWLFIGSVFCAAPASAASAITKIVIVVLENTDYSAAVKQPFLAELSRKGALLTNYYAQTHPSQPNYIALVAGSAYGVDDVARPDGKITLDVQHLGDALERKGLGWRVYAEGYPGKPGTCFLGATSGNYARRHVPFLSFKNIQTNQSRCGRIVNANEFNADVQNSALPEYSLYVPDVKDDGHDTGVAVADKWLKARFEKLLATPRFTNGLLFVVTFDEGRGRKAHKPSHVATILVGDAVRASATSAKAYSHYSLLRLVEDTFGLDKLGQNDVVASAIDDIWK